MLWGCYTARGTCEFYRIMRKEHHVKILKEYLKYQPGRQNLDANASSKLTLTLNIQKNVYQEQLTVLWSGHHKM